MFTKCDLKTLELNDNQLFLGIVRYNDVAVRRKNYIRPFYRERVRYMIEKIGKRNYNLSDQFIIQSLNDYYKRITSSGSLEERNLMFQNYNRLYASWKDLNQAKTERNYRKMDQVYDELTYQLYLLGYKMSNS